MFWLFGFIITFTLGGVTGVMMAVPAIDFQVHNSLFLVAHFHTMIIGGVVFGFFSGLTYWFPKIFGYRLNERLGRYAFWCWFVGFLLAFGPLYILGLMGATRRMDHYDASLGWQGLFIVAACGVAILTLGALFQITQLIVSYFQRGQRRDLTGDPWDGRTLEWSTTSPAPEYNFAVLSEVNDRDAFWAMKQASKANAKPARYEDIYLPKNTGLGIFIAGSATIASFAIVWHIWWLALLGLIGVLFFVIYRGTQEDTERKIPAAEVAAIEAGGKL
jgi:cytochrome o ubiquinol oxidase subunit 1